MYTFLYLMFSIITELWRVLFHLKLQRFPRMWACWHEITVWLANQWYELRMQNNTPCPLAHKGQYAPKFVVNNTFYESSATLTQLNVSMLNFHLPRAGVGVASSLELSITVIPLATSNHGEEFI